MADGPERLKALLDSSPILDLAMVTEIRFLILISEMQRDPAI